MKYHELIDIQFVQCYDIDPSRKAQHEIAEQTEEGCFECMELYLDLQNDLYEEFLFENPNRKIIYMSELANQKENKRLAFGIWSIKK